MPLGRPPPGSVMKLFCSNPGEDRTGLIIDRGDWFCNWRKLTVEMSKA
jgi:hypothetical protein